MIGKNICKFPSPRITDTPTVTCFVLETDPEVIKKEITLKSHRMLLVIKGKGEACIEGEVVRLATGNLLFCFSGERFTAECDAELSYIYIDFDGSRADELLRRFDISRVNRRFEGFDGLIPLFSESLSRADEQTVDLASESILLYTLSRMSGSCARGGSIVGRIVELSESQFTDPELSITSVAKELSYNPKYLSHIFKEKMKVSYSEYLRSLRIKYAVSLFDRGLDSVKNVALLSGFTDPLYFSTVFKKQIGMSPKEYLSKP